MSPRSTCTSEQRVPRPTYRDEEASMASRKSGAHPDPEHQDPITHTPGAHPVGVGAGAASAGAAGAAIGGAMGGPIGAVVGAAVGAVAGGLGGKAAAESVSPTLENTWWRDNYATRPYAKSEEPYETYQPAYRYGWGARVMAGDRRGGGSEAPIEARRATAPGASPLQAAGPQD